MSHYVECKTEFRDPQALAAALIECGFAADQSEVHAEARPLHGYQGDQRAEQAHIIIRRQHIGTAANDVDWERQTVGSYRAWISEYDSRHRFNEERQNRIKVKRALDALPKTRTQNGITRLRLSKTL